MIYLLYVIHVVICVFLILVVLLQQGKGADLSVFGGGGSMATFGARGATTLLHRLTVGSFVAFILTTLGIAILQGKQHRSSVMAGAPTAQTAPATTPTATPAP
ncbi:MAG: preprotein translocase subunit SecG [Holophagales bacterium]|nr:MAG: preprotein translocase subunit SecG [Holophagales bacterium]